MVLFDDTYMCAQWSMQIHRAGDRLSHDHLNNALFCPVYSLSLRLKTFEIAETLATLSGSSIPQGNA